MGGIWDIARMGLVVGQRRFVTMVAIGNGDFLFLETICDVGNYFFVL